MALKFLSWNFVRASVPWQQFSLDLPRCLRLTAKRQERIRNVSQRRRECFPVCGLMQCGAIGPSRANHKGPIVP